MKNMPFFAHCRTQGFPARGQAVRLQKKSNRTNAQSGKAVSAEQIIRAQDAAQSSRGIEHAIDRHSNTNPSPKIAH
jgi:hypothetical protein